MVRPSRCGTRNVAVASQRGAARAADKNQNEHRRADGLTQRQVVHRQES